MLTVNKLMPQGRGLAAVLLKRAASVALDWDRRCKSRFDATDSAGRVLGVFLPRGTVVRGGDVLVADDGSLVVVEAAPQPVLVVAALPRAWRAGRPGTRRLPSGQPPRGRGSPGRPPADRARPCAGRDAAAHAPDRQRRTRAVRARGRRVPAGRRAGPRRARPWTRSRAWSRPRSRAWPRPLNEPAPGHAAATAVAGLAGAAGGRFQLLRRAGVGGRGRPRRQRGAGRRMAAGPAATGPGTRRPAGTGPGLSRLAGP